MSSKSSVSTAAASVLVGAVLALAVALLVQPRSKNAAVPTANRTAEEGLINWVKAKGGTVGFEVKTPPGRPRGAFATRNYRPGETIAKIPESACIVLENNGGYAAEHAYELAVRMTRNRTFFTEYLPFFSTLPRPIDLLTAEYFSDEMMHELQSPNLEKMIARERAIMAAVYYGRYNSEVQDGREFPPLSDVLGDEDTFHILAFRHLTALISSREFSFHNEDGTQGPDRLVPVADLINNDADLLNVKQVTDGHHLYLQATRAIIIGEELYLPYLPGMEHRNDVSLSSYGFLRKLNRPILPATDLPTFNASHPYDTTPLNDEEFYGPTGKYNTKEELERLEELLEDMPTTQEEDEALLQTYTDWRDRVLIEFRIERKKAIRLAIQDIKAEHAKENELLEEAP